MKQIISIFLLAAVSTSAAPQAEKKPACNGTTVDDYSPALAPKAKAFLADLNTAVTAGDKQKVAAMISYPLSVNAKGHRLIRNSARFLKEYDRLFTPAIVKAIETQKPECLFANYQGVMIGSGQIWFDEQKGGVLKIITLNISQ